MIPDSIPALVGLLCFLLMSGGCFAIVIGLVVHYTGSGSRRVLASQLMRYGAFAGMAGIAVAPLTLILEGGESAAEGMAAVFLLLAAIGLAHVLWHWSAGKRKR